MDVYSFIVASFCPSIRKLVRKIKNKINADLDKLVIDTLGQPEENRAKRGHNETINIVVFSNTIKTVLSTCFNMLN